MTDLTATRELYIDSLISMSNQMRKCAELGDSFVKALKGASDEEMRAMFNTNKRKASSALDEDEGPKKRKRNAKPKDPNAPKRPASSYILFQNEIRKELKEKFPELGNSELLGKISEMWKNMSDEEKAQYHKAVESAKERYSQDKKAYDNRTPEEVAAANAAAAEAAAAKRSRPRKKKAADAASAEVPVRPPPAAVETSQSASSEEDESTAEDSDDEDAPADKESQADSDSSEEEEEPEPEEKPTKKSKKAAVPAQQTHKSKKGSK